MTFSITTISIITLHIMTFSTTINKTQHSALDTECFMLSFANKSFMLNNVMLNIIILSVAMPVKSDPTY